MEKVTSTSDPPLTGNIKHNGHFRTYPERPFLKEERAHTTVLIGGLSPAHDYLIEGALRNLGCHVKMLPPTNIEAFHLGREYGNNGLCNPAYFTVGNLIRFLRKLESEGVSKKEINENYVFFTAKCNAPCRFGMYETEFRMALKDCGFEGFRVLTFENEGGLSQETVGDGLQVTPEFFLGLVNAINLADIINEFVYYTRPYEVNRGETDKVVSKALKILHDRLENKPPIVLNGFYGSLCKLVGFQKGGLFLKRIYHQLTSNYYTDTLKEIRQMFDQIEVNRLKPKTHVKITGEFWAMTTVGDGNFDMFRFLENEGAELLVEPVASLIQFLFSKGLLKHRNKRKVALTNASKWWQLKRRYKNYLAYQKRLLILKLGHFLYRREYRRVLKALNGDGHMLIDQRKLQKIGNPYYNINIEGGEGYMEIAKNIYYHENHRAHMVMSLKPFGCMPSTQSDGVQAKVIEKHQGIIFLPLETAGEGKTNAQSRVLMSLSDARSKAKHEVSKAKEEIQSTLEEIKSYADRHPELKSPLYTVPKRNGTVSRTANFIYHVDSLIQKA